jgi:hypothetical protein
LWSAAQQLAAAAQRLAAATAALAAATQQLMAAEPARASAAYARPARRAHHELDGVRGAVVFGPAHYTSRRSSYPVRRQHRTDHEPN